MIARGAIALLTASTLFTVSGLVGCKTAPPRAAEILVYVDTDAPLSPRTGLGAPATAPLFERVRIDVYPPGATEPCLGCTRELAIDDALVRAGASFGVLPSPGTSGWRVRVRFVHSDGEAPRADSSLDGYFSLPTASDGQLVEVTTFLPIASLGTPIGSLEAPALPTTGRVVGHAGEFDGANRRGCRGPAALGRACVPSGAYWMGDPSILAGAPDAFSSGRRIVVVSPFYVDAAEVSVGAFRAWIEAGNTAVIGKYDPSSTTPEARLCGYADDGSHDAMPMTCVSQPDARRFCQARGEDGDLPSEAQLEWMGKALGSARFVWGADDPSCDAAVLGNIAERSDVALFIGSDFCHQPGDPGGPRPVDRAEVGRDLLHLGELTVRDLEGNVEELARDSFGASDGPCWGVGVLRDPVCELRSDYASTRGGGWTTGFAHADFAGRPGTSKLQRHPGIGFRCVYP